jgi:hypothetical protein
MLKLTRKARSFVKLTFICGIGCAILSNFYSRGLETIEQRVVLTLVFSPIFLAEGAVVAGTLIGISKVVKFIFIEF